LSVSGAEGVVVTEGVVVPHAASATAISIDTAALETLVRYRLLMPRLMFFPPVAGSMRAASLFANGQCSSVPPHAPYARP
jgi:hypothetical protein